MATELGGVTELAHAAEPEGSQHRAIVGERLSRLPTSHAAVSATVRGHPSQPFKALLLVPHNLAFVDQIWDLQPYLPHLYGYHYPSPPGLLARMKQLAGSLQLGSAVRFAGHLAHSEVLTLLESAEVALTMSQNPSERLPNVMKEAMLRRCVCLSTRTAGIEELIDDGQTGLIVEPGDIDGAAARLKTLLHDAQAMTEIGTRAQARIAQDFDIDRLMAERLQQWSALLQRPGLRNRP